MPEKKFTISLSRGEPAKDHDERVFQNPNVDSRLSVKNVAVISSEGNYRDLVNDFFHESIVNFNEKQLRYRHRDRMIEDDDYYTALLEGKAGYGSKHKEKDKDGKTIDVDSRETPVLEYVLGIGNRDSLGCTDMSFDYFAWKDLKRKGRQAEADAMVDAHLNQDPAIDDMKDVLTETAQELQSRYPAFHIWSSIIHSDEPGSSAVHMHISFTPFTTGCRTGMESRVSLTRALSSMGFKSDGDKYAITKWQEDLVSLVEEKMLEKGYGREIKNQQKKHEETSAYVSRNEAEYWTEKKEELEAECIKLDEQVAVLETTVENLSSQASSGSTIEELDRLEAELAEQAREQEDMAEQQMRVQAALEDRESAYKKTIDNYKARANAFQDRYKTLFSGLVGTIRRIPDIRIRDLFSNMIKSLQAADKLDRFGINKIEADLAANEAECTLAKQRLDLALKDEQTRIRRSRGRKAAAVSRDVDRESEVKEHEPEL